MERASHEARSRSFLCYPALLKNTDAQDPGYAWDGAYFPATDALSLPEGDAPLAIHH